MACHICAGFCFGGLTLITLSDRTKLPIEAVMMEISMANKQAYRLCESDGCYQVEARNSYMYASACVGLSLGRSRFDERK